MKSSELNVHQCMRITEGCGNSIMYVIKGNNNYVYVTQDTEIKRLAPNEDPDQQFIYDHFAKNAVGVPEDDVFKVIENIKKTSRDWYTLLLCEVILKEL